MSNQSGKIALVLIILLLALAIIAYFFLPRFRLQGSLQVEPDIVVKEKMSKGESKLPDFKSHFSRDLKISLEYPSEWKIDDRYYEVLVANFETSLNSNKNPSADQIQVIIHNSRGCYETIDENLKDPACGEGGKDVRPNEIVSKEIEDLDGTKFYKYLVKYTDGKEQKFYFLEKEDRVLQIDKSPDSSKFEKEFEEVVRSIKFN